ncbi:winged helix DNA-binding domain-containing protein [Nannocystaceae bacterium ST9]
MPPRVLTLRELNRATLARQLLIERESLGVVETIDRLAGLQAQQAKPPFIGLWTRLLGFEREALASALLEREVVRATSMRGTLHLLAAQRFRTLRPALQAGLDKGIKMMRSRTEGIDLAAVVEHARERFARGPATFEVLRDHLLGRFPEADERAIAYVVRCTLPLIQVPVADANWCFPSIAEFALADAWIGQPIAETCDLEELVRHYLAAFGPASIADAQTWSAVPSLKSTFAAMKSELESFRDERGRELFDLPDAPRPPAKTPVPVRLLPDFDNLLLAHDDRSRVISEDQRKRVVTKNLLVLATFLVDGAVAGTWKIERKRKLASLTFTPALALTKKARTELTREALALLAFVEPDAEPAVAFADD